MLEKEIILAFGQKGISGKLSGVPVRHISTFGGGEILYEFRTMVLLNTVYWLQIGTRYIKITTWNAESCYILRSIYD